MCDTDVTIEGTVIPSAFLPTGERITVARTPFVSNLIRNGFVRVVEETPAPGVAVTEVLTGVVDAPDDARRPARSASKDAWRGYLDRIGVPWNTDMRRDDLISLADDHG